MHDIDYQSLFMALPNPKMVMLADDPAFTIVAENDAHARLINSEELTYSIGKPFLEAYPDTSEEYKKTGKNEVIESIRRVIATGQADSMADIRYDLADKNGVFQERWWQATHYPIKVEDGVVTQVLQNTKDITAEVTAKRTLDRTNVQLDLALSAGLVSSFVWDIAGDRVTGDANLAKNFGVSAASAKKGLPLQVFIDSIHEDDRERVSAAIERAVKNGTPYEEEYRTYARDKKISWVIARGMVERDDSDTPVSLAGILFDITERKVAEAEREQVTRMFDALFSSTILSIALADTDGNVLRANQTFLTTFGYSQADLDRGLNSRELTPLDSREVTGQIYDSINMTGEATPIEKDYIRKDGTKFSALVGAARLPGSKSKFMAFILDISENKRLLELSAAKDEFIALASHQLRTPATAVKQYLGLLVQGYAGELDETQTDYLQTAYDSNERELTIINDLLKTAQIDTKGYRLKQSKVDMIALLNDVFSGLQPVLDMKHQTLSFTHSPELFAHADREEVKIVLSNLVENAHKYSHEGKKIHVAAHQQGKWAVVSVRDEGVGIAKADLTSIFEKFTRVNNPLSDSVNGNGLGLYWVKRIVTLHGGSLEVTSQPGAGTTFTVQFPV